MTILLFANLVLLMTTFYCILKSANPCEKGSRNEHVSDPAAAAGNTIELDLVNYLLLRRNSLVLLSYTHILQQ
jgi:hypothetical protein